LWRLKPATCLERTWDESLVCSSAGDPTLTIM
jgi:hypothetical protein